MLDHRHIPPTRPKKQKRTVPVEMKHGMMTHDDDTTAYIVNIDKFETV